MSDNNSSKECEEKKEAQLDASSDDRDILVVDPPGDIGNRK